MNNQFELHFEKAMTCIAGYDYGIEIFTTQIKDKISYTEPIIIIFPDRIIKVASSFVQGLFKEIIDNIGYEGVDRNVTIISGNEKLTNQIRSRIR
ncbi:hypothetical protein SAMN02910358_01827 [Lachnospiraceae bacterium XBB1006]|nr:hypothetical protein SAMN02910358_01827 [Lachnospiraceae bacterium XBB1006]